MPPIRLVLANPEDDVWIEKLAEVCMPCQSTLASRTLHLPHVFTKVFNVFLKPFLVNLISAHTIEEFLGNISLCYIDHLFWRECNHISELFAPALLIHQWRIETLGFAGVDMDPTLEFVNPDFCPYVIGPIKDLSSLIT